jgi:NAD(P)-dependent dehydrogenase (short-subunit alcohol dehydrogenase family)
MTNPKVAIITGASQGIGAAIVDADRGLNYAVVANSRSIALTDDPGMATPIIHPRGGGPLPSVPSCGWCRLFAVRLGSVVSCCRRQPWRMPLLDEHRELTERLQPATGKQKRRIQSSGLIAAGVTWAGSVPIVLATRQRTRPLVHWVSSINGETVEHGQFLWLQNGANQLQHFRILDGRRRWFIFAVRDAAHGFS